MRLAMLGTGPFAVPTFRSLLAARHEMLALVTAPLRVHRGRPVAPPSELREIARQRGLPIFDPEDINASDSVAWLSQWQADLLVVCDYGQILSPAALATARQGGVNLHASLLPKYRGAAPINWAIYHGEMQTGVTVIHMTPQLDAGPCIAQRAVPIKPEETAVELELRLAQIGADLMCQAIDLFAAGKAKSLPQDPALASRAPRLKKTDGLIDWSRPAVAIKNQVRAMEPWPRAYTFWHSPSGTPVRLILGPVAVVTRQTDVESSVLPGTILEAADNRLVIAAGQDAVLAQNIQPAGKRMMTADEFLRGYRVQPGQQFGPEKHY